VETGTEKQHAKPAPNKKREKQTRTRLFLRALRSRNYRLFVAGQSVSLIGTWMQQVAMSWLVYRMTGSAMLLGIVGFTSQIPSFLLAPVAGVFADRWEKRRLLLITQALALTQAALLAIIVLTGIVRIWEIVALSLFLGIVNAFDIPIRQSFIVQMVDSREDLSNAIALNSSMVHGARLIGPTIAGLLVASVGEGVCFAINSVSYLAVITALAGMRLSPQPPHIQRRHVIQELREGARYAFGFKPIRSILLMLALVSLMGMPYSVLIPVFAREVLHGNSHTYGFLMAAAGTGAFAGAIFLASRRSVIGLDRVIARAAILFGAGIAMFALSNRFILSLVSLVVAGFGAMTLVASSNTILQTIVDEDKRGRVMSFFIMSFIGMTPFGSLIAGTLAGQIGARGTVLVGAAFCLACGIFFFRQLPRFREQIKPIYIDRGILQEFEGPNSSTKCGDMRISGLS
jgi:MFS family permease